MKVGGVNESVNVVGAGARCSTPTAPTISETIGKRAIVDLPLSGRNVWSLASTTPGVLGGLNSDIGLSFRGAGQREIQNSLSLDGINSSSNLLAATSMRPIADAVTEIQVQTGSTSAEYGVLPRRPHQRRDQERHQQRRTARCSSSSRTTRSTARGYFENRRTAEEPAAAQPVRRRRWTARSSFPKLYDGHNKTFFMARLRRRRARTR